ncbi:MATE family efflux transporter [Bacteroides stercorirosoris]|uniref:Multidrug export protein MepA n=1 Tax=Bacteroides stercorirosoris TaxID=871324 RepID=A0A1M6IEE9_9BACE|nr:MATE family efflux transporter [Bacteroides stercorirosoris]SHJ32840.1 putative efflux protein, MATE family [Bacteroides stercorirosoris]
MRHSAKDNYVYLTTAPVPRLIVSLAVPTIISMLVTSFYNMADTYFVGKINTQSTAAVGIVFSVMSIIQAVGFFFGHGSGNYISRKLGAQETGNAEKMAATGFFWALFMGIALAVTGLIFLTPLSLALGSTPTILPYTEKYLGIILLGAPFMTASLVMNNQIRFQGNAAYAMVGIVSGAVINVVLDPILIFVFDMGISGAAWATVISQICSFSLLLYMGSKGGNIRIRFRNFTPSLAFIKEIIGGGTPSLARQGLASVATILLNVAAGAYGDAAIAGMSIVTRIAMFINAFLIGFGQGFQPVCGFNYGAGLYGRVRQGFWFCVKVGFIFLLVCAVLGMGFAEEIVSVFRKGDPDVIAVGAAALRWQFITFPLGAWIVVSNMMLQTIRKPVKATILSSARQGLFFIPLIFILPYYLGLQGVEMCQVAADLLTFLLAIPLTGSVLNEMKRKQAEQMQPAGD